ncbi:MAG TPA: hypothetical protein VE377_19095 [Candidatus Dormibacteraeota bacterium]|nr:hypothetical protein [Candidatus Dormibacteraeota bacterium]
MGCSAPLAVVILKVGEAELRDRTTDSVEDAVEGIAQAANTVLVPVHLNATGDTS